jgi:hypothetical protein
MDPAADQTGRQNIVRNALADKENTDLIPIIDPKLIAVAETISGATV